MSLKKVNGLLAGIGILSLSACGTYDVREALGVKNAAPDEYSVVSNNPLAVPPDFELRAPKPGSPRPNENTGSDAAKKLLIGNPDEGVSDTDMPLSTTPAVSGAAPSEPATQAEQSFKERLKMEGSAPTPVS